MASNPVSGITSTSAAVSLPPAPASLSGSASSPAAMEFAERVIENNDLRSIYAKKHVGLIRKDLQGFYDRIVVRDGSAIGPYEDRLGEIFAERSEFCRNYLNVKRQEREIRRAELRPGEIPEEEGGIPAFARQMQREIGYRREGLRGWIGRTDGYGDEPVGTRGVDHMGSIIGGTAAELRSIMERDEPIIHTKPVDLNYRNNVFDAKSFAIENMRLNDLRLETFLSEAREPTKEEYSAASKISTLSHRMNNLAESAVSGINNVIGSVGRGIIHETDHTEDKRYHKFIDKRNELIASLLWSLDPEDRTEYLRMLERVSGSIGDSDLLDPSTFSRMQNLISEEIKKEKGINQRELDAFNEQLREINKRMLEDMEDIVASEDDMFKWRVLQVFLMLSPLGAFTVAGEVFNYIDPLAELFGPLLDSSLSFGESLAKIGTSDQLGFIGDMADAMGFDEAVRFVFDDVPVVSDVCNAFKEIVISNPVSQEFFDIASPLLGSPLLPIGIAGAYSFSQAGAEMDLYWGNPDTKEPGANKIIERHNKDLENLFEKFGEDTDQSKEDRIREFCDQRFQTFVRMYVDTEFVKYAVEAGEQDLQVFDKKFKDSEGNKITISELRKKYPDKEEFKTALETIIADDKNRDSLLDSIRNFTVLQEVSGNIKEFRRAKSLPKEFEELQSRGHQNIETKFVIESARRLNIHPGAGYAFDSSCYDSEAPIIPPEYDGPDASLEYILHDLDNQRHLSEKGVRRLEDSVADLRNKLKGRDFDHIFGLAKSTIDTPNSSFSPESTSKLHGSERLFGSNPAPVLVR